MNTRTMGKFLGAPHPTPPPHVYACRHRRRSQINRQPGGARVLGLAGRGASLHHLLSPPISDCFNAGAFRSRHTQAIDRETLTLLALARFDSLPSSAPEYNDVLPALRSIHLDGDAHRSLPSDILALLREHASASYLGALFAIHRDGQPDAQTASDHSNDGARWHHHREYQSRLAWLAGWHLFHLGEGPRTRLPLD